MIPEDIVYAEPLRVVVKVSRKRRYNSGNFTLQFNMRVRNSFPFPVVPQIFVITANSGYFESIRGSSRIIKGVLSEQDIISAPLAPAGTRQGLKRLIGGKVMALANRLGMSQGGARAAAPAAAAPQGKVGGARGLAGRLM